MERPPLVELSDESFESFVARGLVVVEFAAAWCLSCRVQEEVMAELAESLGERVKFGRLNAEASELPSRLSVHAVPTQVIFLDGREVQRFVGAQPRERLLHAIERHAGSSGSRRMSETNARPAEHDLLCRKSNQKVPASAPRCLHPDEPCKFRTQCLIYALAQENEPTAAPSGANGAWEDDGKR